MNRKIKVALLEDNLRVIKNTGNRFNSFKKICEFDAFYVYSLAKGKDIPSELKLDPFSNIFSYGFPSFPGNQKNCEELLATIVDTIVNNTYDLALFDTHLQPFEYWRYSKDDDDLSGVDVCRMVILKEKLVCRSYSKKLIYSEYKENKDKEREKKEECLVRIFEIITKDYENLATIIPALKAEYLKDVQVIDKDQEKFPSELEKILRILNTSINMTFPQFLAEMFMPGEYLPYKGFIPYLKARNDNKEIDNLGNNYEYGIYEITHEPFPAFSPTYQNRAEIYLTDLASFIQNTRPEYNASLKKTLNRFNYFISLYSTTDSQFVRKRLAEEFKKSFRLGLDNDKETKWRDLIEGAIRENGLSNDDFKIDLPVPNSDNYLPSFCCDTENIRYALGKVLCSAMKYNKDGPIRLRLKYEKDEGVILFVSYKGKFASTPDSLSENRTSNKLNEARKTLGPYSLWRAKAPFNDRKYEADFYDLSDRKEIDWPDDQVEYKITFMLPNKPAANTSIH